MGAAVLDGDALGASGGSGGIDDVGEVVGADLARGQRQVVRLVAALLQRQAWPCLLYTSPSPRDPKTSR
ncbi:hypothetical protein KZ869_33370, partial [Pseudomonas aeruginosa]